MNFRWFSRARRLRGEVYALYLACRDPRVPWYAKAIALLVVAYAFSPIDLIPDFIPVLGLLDDIILIPIGFAIVRRMVPPAIMAEHRAAAENRYPDGTVTSLRSSCLGALVVLAIWFAVLALAAVVVLRLLHG